MDKGSILLVDDEKIVEQLEQLLKNEGYNVDTAYNGTEGWQKCQSNYFDLVITDWKMPERNAWELVYKINTTYPSIKVIIITDFLGGEFHHQPIKDKHYHPFDYIEKPLKIKILLPKVKEAMQQRDKVIVAIEDWVEKHPEEAKEPFLATFTGDQEMSIKDILDEIRKNSELGRQMHKELLQASINLLKWRK